MSPLWINGKKLTRLLEARVSHKGGRGARLWEVPRGILVPGRPNRVAIRVHNTRGPGGIDVKPVRFEIDGRNDGLPLPYEFIRSKFNPYYHWVW